MGHFMGWKACQGLIQTLAGNVMLQGANGPCGPGRGKFSLKIFKNFQIWKFWKLVNLQNFCKKFANWVKIAKFGNFCPFFKGQLPLKKGQLAEKWMATTFLSGRKLGYFQGRQKCRCHPFFLGPSKIGQNLAKSRNGRIWKIRLILRQNSHPSRSNSDFKRSQNLAERGGNLGSDEVQFWDFAQNWGKIRTSANFEVKFGQNLRPLHFGTGQNGRFWPKWARQDNAGCSFLVGFWPKKLVARPLRSVVAR